MKSIVYRTLRGEYLIMDEITKEEDNNRSYLCDITFSIEEATKFPRFSNHPVTNNGVVNKSIFSKGFFPFMINH